MDAPYLTAEHRAMLAASGISEEFILVRGYETVIDKRRLLGLGFGSGQCRVPGLLVPIHAAGGNIGTFQFRPDSPRMVDGKAVKYESLPGKVSRLDVPPSVRELVADPNIDLWITEGVKKADSAACRGLACVALPGVWNFKGRNEHGGSTVIGDFDQVPLKGRRCYIVFDSDAAVKKGVREAESRLAGFLRSRGADPMIVRIPPGPGGQKVGLDDYLAADGTPEALLQAASEVSDREAAGAGRRDTSKLLLELIEAEGVELWHGSNGEAYASFRQVGQRQHALIKSGQFDEFLASLMYAKTGGAIGATVKDGVAAVLAAKAKHAGLNHHVERRVGYLEGQLFLALHDGTGRVVAVSAGGWQVVDSEDCPIRFVQAPSARALPLPVPGGDLSSLRAFVNVGDDDWPLVPAFLAGCFLPVGTFPVLLANGEQGSGKTFACSLLRQLVDPADPPLRKCPKSQDDLMAALQNCYVLAFDNLSTIREDISDSLCSASSGGGFAARTLYTNAEETTIKARRPVILNGIGEVVTRPDLADRSLQLRFQALAGRREGEAQLLARFESTWASLLGALLDRVARGLERWETIGDVDHRLCDFVRWALACSPAGEEPALRGALNRNRAEMNGNALENDDFARAVVALIDEEGPLILCVGEVLSRACRFKPCDRPASDWPKSPRAASSHLERIAPVLRATGYSIERLPRTNHQRAWSFKKQECAEPSQPSLASPVERNEPTGGSTLGVGKEAGTAVCHGPSRDPSPGGGADSSLGATSSDGRDGGDVSHGQLMLIGLSTSGEVLEDVA